MPGDPLDNSTIGDASLAEQPPTTASIKTLRTTGDSFTELADNWLQAADFYHGYLPREDIPPLLLKNGDFLVRMSEANVKVAEKKKTQRTTSRVISVLAHPESKTEFVPLDKRASLIKNIVIMHKNKKWWIDPAVQFDTLASLFENYMTKPLLVEKDTVLLKRGVGLCRWEFKHGNVQVGRLLGRGAYGEVRKGTVIRKNGNIVNVAVKTLTMRNELTRELIREIMKEARTMRDLHHPNVVSLIGVVLIDHPLYILLEYVSGGALDVYLRRKRTKITKGERLSMAIGVALGMDYIHKANVIHRDIAARNCLYDRSNTVKISDFGLARQGTSYKMKTAQKMPIKWMAPESILTFTFTQKTDVYTFGVLVFEIFAATGPYEDLRNSVVKKMIVDGVVNKFPSSTPDVVVSFVKEKLWCKDPDKRPNFASIVGTLEKLTISQADKIPDAADDRSGIIPSEGKTTATVDLDIPDQKIAISKPVADTKKLTVVPSTPKKEVASKEGVSKDVVKKTAPTKEQPPKDTKQEAKKSKPEISTRPAVQDASSYLKPPTSADVLKLTQPDVDSCREKDELNVEIRTKPIFGRRSKFKRARK
ncbi:hypothetical protein RB195_012738 [Necator americanus]|uniref:Tyrosine-protein kinase n=1 Tax=Necator americanus TaxID=51031 RepID=A0ABR1DSE0_NECAM